MARTASEFKPAHIAVLTISNSRTAADDTSGDYLVEQITEIGHALHSRAIVADDLYQIRAVVSNFIADPQVQVVIMSGGTGFNIKNSTPEAIQPLFDKEIEGFGELFRMLSFQDIGSSSLQSRAIAGLANQTAIFALPGSTGACRLGREQLIQSQLDARHRPCNFMPHLVSNDK